MADRMAAELEAGVTARPSVIVVATTGDSTPFALSSARRLASARDARIVLIVPQLTSFADAPLSQEDRHRAIDDYRGLARQAGVAAQIVCCACRRYDDIRALLDRSSLVIVGGRRSAFWPSREQRFADWLSADGFDVLLVQPVGPLAETTISPADPDRSRL